MQQRLLMFSAVPKPPAWVQLKFSPSIKDFLEVVPYTKHHSCANHIYRVPGNQRSIPLMSERRLDLGSPRQAAYFQFDEHSPCAEKMDAENWASISDAALRRRVQNRNAQVSEIMAPNLGFRQLTDSQRRYRKKRQNALEKLMQDRCSCQKKQRARDQTPEQKEDQKGGLKRKEQLCSVLERSSNCLSTSSEEFLVLPWYQVNPDWEHNLPGQDNGHGNSSLGSIQVPPPTPSDADSIENVESTTEMWLSNPFTQAFVKLADLELGRKF